MSDAPLIPAEMPLAPAAPDLADPTQTPPPEASPSSPKEPAPMLDVHPAHHAASSWKEFIIHIATIVLGLLIAVGLEQAVEYVHHSHQRHQLDEDLHTEAENNLRVIDRDLRMQDLESWFVQAQTAASMNTPSEGKTRFHLAPPPCVAGSVGTAAIRYFAPSEAVWTAASESGLVALLPPDQARLQARLAHNYDLLAGNRADVYEDCQEIIAMCRRLSVPGPAGSDDTWTITPQQAEKFAATAAATKVAIEALDFRLRWTKVYEQGIARGDSDADVDMMTMDQTRFEDTPDH